MACFQALVKPAIVFLLLLRLERPAGARELADILGMDEHTVAKYLRMLSKLNLVIRIRHQRGYTLVGNHQMILGACLTVNKLQFEPSTTADQILGDQENKYKLTEEVDQTQNGAQQRVQPTPSSIAALRSIGIGEPKRSNLARLPFITPEYIHAWHTHLKYVKGEAFSLGLLIHVLETGDSAPALNEHGHHLACACEQCHPVIHLICPECHCRPCVCD